MNYTSIKGKNCRIMWNNREATRHANPDANIFVKNLDPSIDSKSLSDTFSIFGQILSCKVACDLDGSSRGYGFVQYESVDAAKQAIERVNGMLIAGRKVFVGPFIKRGQDRRTEQGGENSCYIRNVPGSWDDTKVTDLFAEY